MLDPQIARRKAELLAERAAAEPRDPAAERDHQRWNELQALLTGRGRGYLTPEERAELNEVNKRREERARERAQAQRDAVQQAEAAKQEARQRAAGEQQRAEVRAQVQRITPGLSGAALESAVDRILVDRAAAQVDAVRAEKLRQIGGVL